MSYDEIVARRFGPGQKNGSCADPAVTCCAAWECQSRNRCRKSFNPVAEEQLRSFDNGPSR